MKDADLYISYDIGYEIATVITNKYLKNKNTKWNPYINVEGKT